MRREVFLEIGGFTEALPSNFNDVDLCYKVLASGRRTVWVANCELFHFESQTRDGTVQPWERHFVVRRWGVPDRDRFTPASLAQPNLDPHRLLDARLAEPRARRADGARGRAKAKRAGRSTKA
jgi:GT2 family glycosyltransferase